MTYVFEITDIVEIGDLSVTVKNAAGKEVRVPRWYGRQEVDFLPRRIVMPDGLGKRFKPYFGE